MEKVYLLQIAKGDWDDYHSWVEDVYGSLDSAQKAKKQLEEKIQNIKTQYWLEFNSDYEEDLVYINESDDFGYNYNTVVHNVYNFQHIHPELNYESITIVEREVLI